MRAAVLCLLAVGVHRSGSWHRAAVRSRVGVPVACASQRGVGAESALSSAEYTKALLTDEAEVAMKMAKFGLTAERPAVLPQRGVFCTRALDLREIKAIGYDMDYTLIDYKMVLLEERVYHYSKEFLRSKGFPVSGLRFNHELVVRGLIVDTLHGHTLKVDRFGYVRRAMHGTRMLSRQEIIAVYGNGPPIDLRDSRWRFLNTLFSVSEGCLYAQLGAPRHATAALAPAPRPPAPFFSHLRRLPPRSHSLAGSRPSRFGAALHRLQGAVRRRALLLLRAGPSPPRPPLAPTAPDRNHSAPARDLAVWH